MYVCVCVYAYSRRVRKTLSNIEEDDVFYIQQYRVCVCVCIYIVRKREVRNTKFIHSWSGRMPLA